MVFDLSLYLVLDPVLCGGKKGMVQTAIQAATSGVTMIQLRAPGWSRTMLVDCAQELLQVLRPRHIPLIVNNDPVACVESGADGVHVGQSDMPPVEARKIIGPEGIIGLSVSNLQELENVPTHCVDYLGVGPVFPTTTKSDAAVPMGLDRLRHLVHNATLPCVAIGGIGLSNARSIMQTQVDGIAVVSAICGKADVKGTIQALLTTILETSEEPSECSLG